MKKRSLLAFASLAVGVVASLTAPSAAHATHEHAGGTTPHTDTLSAPDRPLAENVQEDGTPA
ncbi:MULTISPECIES: hypothetical protein [Kitasatospora]|uniref:hypothetical protein n=1 Tax=Kitasatospora TaxID=2063 RepID=UPI000C272BA5|nr:hypothetical protein [Kitasatospora sp. CB02891]PJN22341.1 hypothetical protein CG736_27845 [Kitasatospora sp. CB02891]